MEAMSGISVFRRILQSLRRTSSSAEFDFSNMDQFEYDEMEGDFEVYTLESTLPKIDWDAIEAHLETTRQEERRRRNDREEIRRKLAMGIDDEIPVRKSLQSRLQNGMNLQICFMNETANSDCESQCSDTESTRDQIEDSALLTFPPMNKNACDLKEENDSSSHSNFFAKQAQLQAEARIALAQAKDMARIQMEIEKQAGRHSPVTDIVRDTFKKIGVFPNVKRRFSRHILTDMNVAQLQVIVNELHTQSEYLSEELVQYLLQRDDLHMEQDSMLVDIEDLTKHLSAKEKTFQFEKASLIMQDTLSTVSESPRCRKK